MNPSKDISDYIIKCVQEAWQDILSSQKSECGDAEAMSATSDLFMRQFQMYLSTAINIVYFNENVDQETDSQPNKDELEYEKAVMDTINKRRQGTKVCKDVLEKTLSIEKKAVMAAEIGPGIVSIQKIEKTAAPLKKDEIKLGVKKTVECLKNSCKQVIELNDRTEELVKAAIIFKDSNSMDFETY